MTKSGSAWSIGMHRRAQSFVRYGRFLRSLLRDSVLRYPLKAFAVVGLSTLGVLLQLFVFVAIIHYASAIATGRPVEILGYHFGERGSFVDLFIVLVISCSVLLLAALCVFGGKVMAIDMGRQYEVFCAGRVFLKVADNTHRPNLPSKSYLDLARKDSFMRGRVLRILMDMSYSTLTFLIAIVYVVYQNALLTAGVGVIAALSLVAQERISRQAAADSQKMEKFGRAASRVYKENMGDLLSGRTPRRGNVVSIFEAPAVTGFMDAFDGRLKSTEYSRLTSAIVYSITLGMILVVLGGEIIARGEGWAMLLSYIVASRFALSSMQSILIGLTSLNRFYPQLRRYEEFVETADMQTALLVANGNTIDPGPNVHANVGH